MLISIGRREKVVEILTSAQALQTRGLVRKPGLRDNPFELEHILHAFDDFFDLGPHINGFSVIHSPIVHEDVDRLDLEEAFKDALGSHVRAAGAKKSSYARDGHEAYEGIKTSTRDNSHTITLLQAFCAERVG
jgi:hypothetical protein